MMRACRLIAGVVLLSCWLLSADSASAAQFEIWAADPLVKIFHDSVPLEGFGATAEVARGEHASLQVVVRADVPLEGLRAEVTDFSLCGNSSIRLKSRPPRFVGYVPVDLPIQSPPKDSLCKLPAEFPDPLLEVESVAVKAGAAQPIWITVPIPEESTPGVYEAKLKVTANDGEEKVSAELPLQIHVFAAKVGKTRLWVTNWFVMESAFEPLSPARDSPDYWRLLRKYARNMADHRQNVALISPLDLAEYRAAGDGKLQIDFSRFDRWIDIFKDEGVLGRIEGGHIGDRVSHFRSPFFVYIQKIENGEVVKAKADPKSADAELFYSQFFPALVRHLRDRGLLEVYMQHLVDEPVPQNVDGYRAIAELCRKYAPELKIIEACHTENLVGSIDVWVPMLNFYHKNLAHYEKRQQAGEEVWFYTCWQPQKEYANRFIEQPLIKTRLLHWINFRYGATGYLHWGYNQWTKDDPFVHTAVFHNPLKPKQYLPAGDSWIVYPGKDGPIDSIRHEAMRDGIVDHELLSQLAERDRDVAMRLAAEHIQDFDRYNTDVSQFRATRRKLLEALSR